MMNTTQLTYDALIWMTPADYEERRAAGFSSRNELTHAVMRELNAPLQWKMNGEYRHEFGGMFPVQCRFTPAHGDYEIAVCSYGAVSASWLVVIISQRTSDFKVLRRLDRFSPPVINNQLLQIAQLDVQGYNMLDIFSLEQGAVL